MSKDLSRYIEEVAEMTDSALVSESEKLLMALQDRGIHPISVIVNIEDAESRLPQQLSDFLVGTGDPFTDQARTETEEIVSKDEAMELRAAWITAVMNLLSTRVNKNELSDTIFVEIVNNIWQLSHLLEALASIKPEDVRSVLLGTKPRE